MRRNRRMHGSGGSARPNRWFVAVFDGNPRFLPCLWGRAATRGSRDQAFCGKAGASGRSWRSPMADFRRKLPRNRGLSARRQFGRGLGWGAGGLRGRTGKPARRKCACPHSRRRRGCPVHPGVRCATVSLVLATHARSYVRGLAGFRSVDGDGQGLREGVNERVPVFAGACAAACGETEGLEESTARLQADWREALGSVRANPALELLIRELAGMPIFSVKTASPVTGRKPTATMPSIERCMESDLVVQTKAQKRNRSFEVPEAINELGIFERGLASPTGDTKAAKPARTVPEMRRTQAERRARRLIAGVANE